MADDRLNNPIAPQLAAALTECDKASLNGMERRYNARPLLEIKEAAKLLGVSTRTVKRWQAAGKMPARTEANKRKHRWRYARSDIEAMIAAKAASTRS
jgi:excisionase family DNA binding protein